MERRGMAETRGQEVCRAGGNRKLNLLSQVLSCQRRSPLLHKGGSVTYVYGTMSYLCLKSLIVLTYVGLRFFPLGDATSVFQLYGRFVAGANFDSNSLSAAACFCNAARRPSR